MATPKDEFLVKADYGTRSLTEHEEKLQKQFVKKNKVLVRDEEKEKRVKVKL